MELNPINQNLVTFDEWGVVDDAISPSTTPVTWNYWSASGTWLEILNQQSLEVSLLSLDAKELFNTYSGLSSGIVSDSSVLSVSNDSVVIINDVAWDQYLF